MKKTIKFLTVFRDFYLVKSKGRNWCYGIQLNTIEQSSTGQNWTQSGVAEGNECYQDGK